VTNGIKASKAMLVLLAPDTEVSEALDGKLSALIDEAQSRDVPILYCLTRRKLGKALHSSMKQAAVAIYDANGAYEQFRQIVQYALTTHPAAISEVQHHQQQQQQHPTPSYPANASSMLLSSSGTAAASASASASLEEAMLHQRRQQQQYIASAHWHSTGSAAPIAPSTTYEERGLYQLHPGCIHYSAGGNTASHLMSTRRPSALSTTTATATTSASSSFSSVASANLNNSSFYNSNWA
jgi:ribosomal protein L7Ae-like RNA K-turn-binding protein